MFLAVIAIGLVVAWIVRSAPTEVAKVGSDAPDFTVELIDGGTFTLSEALGSPVVLNFWASWCEPCRTEIPDITTFAEANPEVTVIGVAVEDVEDASREFATEIDAGYPLGLGTTEVEEAYPRLGLPVTYIIDAGGTVTEVVNGIVDENVLLDLVQSTS